VTGSLTEIPQKRPAPPVAAVRTVITNVKRTGNRPTLAECYGHKPQFPLLVCTEFLNEAAMGSLVIRGHAARAKNVPEAPDLCIQRQPGWPALLARSGDACTDRRCRADGLGKDIDKMEYEEFSITNICAFEVIEKFIKIEPALMKEATESTTPQILYGLTQRFAPPFRPQE